MTGKYMMLKARSLELAKRRGPQGSRAKREVLIHRKAMLIIYGPTATGKTDLAINLAKKYNGEIISADSRQVYKSLDIGTGKVSFESKIERHRGYWIVDGVKINGFDIVNPGEQFTAANFVYYANNSIIRIVKQKKLPIIVGGTGFYIKALIDGIESMGIPADQKLRKQLEKLSVADLFKKLTKTDPKRAKSMNNSDSQNPRRLIRAIEIAQTSLTPGLRKVASKHIPGVSLVNGHLSDVNCLLIGLTAPNDYLYSRADKWLETRLKHGMIQEIENLLKNSVNQNWFDNLGLEYHWLSRYLSGKIERDKAIERLKGDIHKFIRRQKTWFSKFPDIRLYDISKPNWQNEFGKNGLSLLN